MSAAKSITDLLQSLSRDSVSIQTDYDRAFLQQVISYHPAHDRLNKVNPAVERTLRPQRQFLKRYEVSLRVALEASRERGVSIRATPLNIGFDLIHQTTNTSESKLTLVVEQVPARNSADYAKEGYRG